MVKNREGDIYSMKGQHIHQFDRPASSMILTYTGKTLIFLTKNSPELVLFSLKTLSYWADTIQISAPTEEHLTTASKSNRIFVAYKSLSAVDVIEMNEELQSSQLLTSINLSSHIPSVPEIGKIELSSTEQYLLLSANMEVFMWDLQSNKLYRKFSIPEEAKSKYNVKTFKSCLDPRNNTLVMIHDERLIVFK